jgi:SAM-dependent methyltransferase
MKGKMKPGLYQELFQVENQHWWHEHKRKLAHFLIQKYARKGRVLDLGAGTGKMLQELEDKGWQTEGLEGEKEAIEWSKKRGVKLRLFDLNKPRLPFKTNSFALAMALDTLEHLSNDLALLKEMKRLAKPQGLILITVPAYPWLFSYWDRMLGHQRRYSRKSVVNLIKKSGLKIEFLSYFSSFWLLPAVLVRVTKSFLSRKPVSDFQTTPFPSFSLPIIKLLSRVERIILSWTRLPAGLSIVCLARKI